MADEIKLLFKSYDKIGIRGYSITDISANCQRFDVDDLTIGYVLHIPFLRDKYEINQVKQLCVEELTALKSHIDNEIKRLKGDK